MPAGAVMQEAPKAQGGSLKKILTIAAGIILGCFLVILALFVVAKISGSSSSSSSPSSQKLGDSRLKVTMDKLGKTEVIIGLRNRNSSPLVVEKMEMQVHLDNKLVGSMTKTNFEIASSWATTVSLPIDVPSDIKAKWPDVKYNVSCDFVFKDFYNGKWGFRGKTILG